MVYIHDLMEENHWENHERQETARAWMEEVRNTVPPLVNSRPEEVLERHRPWSFVKKYRGKL